MTFANVSSYPSVYSNDTIQISLSAYHSSSSIYSPSHFSNVVLPTLPIAARFSAIHITSFLAISLISYLLYVRHLRFRAINLLQKQYGSKLDEFKNINYKDAQSILANLFLLEAPWLFLTSKDFAFLRAFGIKSIAEVSIKAKKMVENPGLRYSDTIVFATEWILNPLDSERAILSINRVNFIHSRYRGIDNAQMVYTLCLLVCEVFDWIDNYEYRESVPLEQYASYVFWKEVGIRMGIAESLIPESFEDCAQFIKDYEAREMGHSANSERIGEAVLKLYEATLPSFIRPLFTNIVVSFMDPIIRSSFNLNLKTTHLLGFITMRLLPVALLIRKKFVRHCLLPRRAVPKIFEPTKDGERMHVIYWQMLPHYAPATVWNRWGPQALYRRAFGLDNPGSDWVSEGYKLEEVGYDGKGADKVLAVMDRAKEGGCPYSTFGRVSNEEELGGIYKQFGSGCPMSMS